MGPEILIPIAGMLIVAGIFMLLAYLWGKNKGERMASEVIKDAFVDAGLAEERFHEIMSRPLDSPVGLFDDWVQDSDNS